jgi:hypothetical protein
METDSPDQFISPVAEKTKWLEYEGALPVVRTIGSGKEKKKLNEPVQFI